MSRLWPERLLISLEPTTITWVRLRGGVRARVVAEGKMDADPVHGTESWQGPLQSLRKESEGWKHERLRVSVALSNHFVRYARLPAPGSNANREEEIALARFHFGKIHGERARDWDIRISEGNTAPRLACAADSALVAALKACFPSGGKARLVSVQPYLISAFNRWRSQVPRAGAWLLLLEPDRYCLALYAAGGWHAVHNARGTAENSAEWAALLERERFRADTPHKSSIVLVSCHSDSAIAEETAGPWTFRRVGQSESHRAMAFSAQ